MSKRNLVFGVGINDADYKVMIHDIVDGKDKIIWICPYYNKWYDMLRRCYSKRYQKGQPTYKGCYVCKEWLLFSNFRAWMIQQEWEGRCLDKDFLIEGNKMYSPVTCAFIPQRVNKFIITSGRIRGEYPIGVCLERGGRKNLYKSQGSIGSGTSVYLGHFPTPQEAHQAWMRKKLEVCKEYLTEFKDEPLLVKGLTRIKNKLEYHIENNLELTSF